MSHRVVLAIYQGSENAGDDGCTERDHVALQTSPARVLAGALPCRAIVRYRHAGCAGGKGSGHGQTDVDKGSEQKSEHRGQKCRAMKSVAGKLQDSEVFLRDKMAMGLM
jgi:hypothetical protein